MSTTKERWYFYRFDKNNQSINIQRKEDWESYINDFLSFLFNFISFKTKFLLFKKKYDQQIPVDRKRNWKSLLEILFNSKPNQIHFNQVESWIVDIMYYSKLYQSIQVKNMLIFLNDCRILSVRRKQWGRWPVTIVARSFEGKVEMEVRTWETRSCLENNIGWHCPRNVQLVKARQRQHRSRNLSKSYSRS